ncbi:hypothetical protein Tco_0178207 [Tanacetum coccineum]
MANLEFYDKHNMVAYLKKPTGSEGFQEIVDFLNGSHIRYALTKNPTIYVYLIKKFWQTATVRTVDNGEQEITATVDDKEFIFTEACVRRHLQLTYADGISALPNTKIFDQLSLMGYVLIDDKLTFQKGKFSPQWRFLIHTILHYLSPKKTSYEQFSSNTATAIICLATNRTFNFSKLVFDEPISNVVSSSHQKTQTPRQALNKVTKLPQTSEPIPNVADEAVYEEWDDRVERAAITAASLDAEHASGGSPRCQEAMEGSIGQTRFERVPTQSNDPPLSRGHTLGSGEDSIELIKELMETCTKLSERVLALEKSKTAQDLLITRLKLRVKKLEKKRKKARTPQPMKRRLFKVRVESFTDENLDEEDPSKQGRSMIAEIDQDAGVTLVQIDAEDQGRFDDETDFDEGFYKVQVSLTQDSTQGEAHSQEDQPEDHLRVLSAAKVLVDAARKNVHAYTRRRRVVSTGSGGISTASRLFKTAEESVSTAGASMPVSTAGMVQEVNISIPSSVVVKDKGKGKMKESEDEQTKRTKLQQEQDKLGHEAAVRLQEERDEEERQRMARVHEAAQSFTEEE